MRIGRIVVVLLAALAVACTQPDAARDPSPTQTAEPTPTPSPIPEWLIAAAGDIACSASQRARRTDATCRERETSELLAGKDLDAVLLLGDIQYETGLIDDYRRVFAPTWGRFKPLLRPALGNHDYGRNAAGYFEYFGAAAGPRTGWYSFDVGPWHIIALNSNCVPAGGCGPGSPQVQWLRRDLAGSTASCTLAYWHHARFSSGLHGPDDRMVDFWRALHEAGADIVLSGHDHHYERFALQDPEGRPDPRAGVRQFVVGSGGRSLYAVVYGRVNSQYRTSRAFGVLFLTLREGSYDWRFADVTGRTLDSGTDRCR